MTIQESNTNGYVFVPVKEDILCGRCLLRYDGSLNQYTIGLRDATGSKTSPQWQSTVFSYENIKRGTDVTSGEVYLERKNKTQNAYVSWRFDFSTTGLVVDYLYMKINAEEVGGGQVTICLSGDAGYKWVPYFSTGSYGTIKGLSGSKTIRINANLLGANNRQITRLLNQKLHDERVCYALDIQVRLKRPDFMVGRSLLFLGLLFSSKDTSPPRVPKKRKNEGKVVDKNNDVMLSIHIFKAKRLPCRKNGLYPRPKVKCTLLSGTNVCKIKTKHHSKTLNPCWNEYLNIPHPNSDVLKNSSLVLNVTNSKVFISRSSEVLGHVCLQENPELTSFYQGEATDHPRKRFCSSRSDDIVLTSQSSQYQSGNYNPEDSITPFTHTHHPVVPSDIDSEDEIDILHYPVAQDKNEMDEENSMKIPEIRIEEHADDYQREVINDIPISDSSYDHSDYSRPMPSQTDLCKHGTITSFRSINLDSRLLNRSFSLTSDGYNSVSHKQSLPLDKGDGSNTFYTLSSRKPSFGSQTQSMDKKLVDQYKRGKGRAHSFDKENDEDDFCQYLKANIKRNGINKSDNHLGPFYDYSDKDFNSKCYINIENGNIDDIMSNDINASVRTLTQYPMIVVNSIKNYPEYYKRTSTNDSTMERQNQSSKGKRVTRSRSFSTSDIDRRHLKLNFGRLNLLKHKPLSKQLLSTKIYRSGSISNILEDESFEEKASELSHKHWTEAFTNPGRWFYCWHPLLGVDNLLNC